MTSPLAGRSTVYRCPACGQCLDSPPPSQCPLCGFNFGDNRATGADVTPYATAYAQKERGWYVMSEWVWFAGWERLKHLGLMRASAASTRFARLNALVLALGLGIFQATRYGWRWVTNSPALDPHFEPSGIGWLQVASAPQHLMPQLAPEVAVNLWWNPLQAGVAVGAGLAAGLLLMWVVLALLRAGVTLAHKPPYREEQQMSAAIHYSTAWGFLIFAGTLVAGLRPVSYLGAMQRWSWYPPQHSFELAAVVVAGFGVAFGWFWLLRLGAMAPASTRNRVVAFFALGAPVIVCGAAAGWQYGLDQLYGHVFTKLGVAF